MRLRDVIPGLGKSKTRRRIKKLEQKAGTLPVMFALFFTEFIKIATLAIPTFSRSAILDASMMLGLALLTGVLYVRGVDISIEDVVYDE